MALNDLISTENILIFDQSKFGENMAGLIVMAAATETTSTMTVLSAADPVARAISMRLLEDKIVRPLAEWIGPP